MCFSSSNSKLVYISTYCISAQTDQAERDITNHASGGNQITESLILAQQAPKARKTPG